jgi:hypothetical protein
MRQNELVEILKGKGIQAAKEVAQATENPMMQLERGWDLTNIIPRTVPGCIQFGIFEDHSESRNPEKFALAAVAVINAPESRRAEFDTGNYPIPTVVLMEG